MFLEKLARRFQYAFKTDRELVELLLERQEIMSQALEELKAAIARETSVTNSLRVLLGSIKGRLDEAIQKLSSAVPVDDTADLRELSASLMQDIDANAAALLANTPAEVAPVAPPVAAPPSFGTAGVGDDPVSTPSSPAAGSESSSS